VFRAGSANQQVVLSSSAIWPINRDAAFFSTHDPLHALQVASHTLLLLPEGKWRAGPTDSIVTEENLFLAYGLPLRKLSVENHPTPFIAPLFSIRR
jgi:iron complex transport system ATP-binding protein